MFGESFHCVLRHLFLLQIWGFHSRRCSGPQLANFSKSRIHWDVWPVAFDACSSAQCFCSWPHDTMSHFERNIWSGKLSILECRKLHRAPGSLGISNLFVSCSNQIQTVNQPSSWGDRISVNLVTRDDSERLTKSARVFWCMPTQFLPHIALLYIFILIYCITKKDKNMDR